MLHISWICPYFILWSKLTQCKLPFLVPVYCFALMIYSEKVLTFSPFVYSFHGFILEKIISNIYFENSWENLYLLISIIIYNFIIEICKFWRFSGFEKFILSLLFPKPSKFSLAIPEIYLNISVWNLVTTS